MHGTEIPRGRARFARAAILVALLAEGLCLFVASRYGDLSVSGHPVRMVAALLAAGVCFFGVVPLWPNDSWRSLAGLWFCALAFRATLLFMEPGDDFWRYVWEGRVQERGMNPYLLSPDAPELENLRDETWPLINHPYSPAIYPPAAELVFRGLARLSTALPAACTPTLIFKTCFVLADLATLALLLVLLQRGRASRRSPEPSSAHRLTAWYALNPAVIYAFAGAAHYDSLMICALLGAVTVLTIDSRRSAPVGWPAAIVGATSLGLAIALKLVPIFLLPLFACALGRRWPVLLLALVLPAALAGPFGGMTVLGPLLAFAEVTRFNDLLWWLIESIIGPNVFGRNWPFTLVLGVVVAWLSWRHRRDWSRGVLAVLGALLICSPTLHPWYATWILPFAVWRRSHVWTVLSLSVLAALLLWEGTLFWSAWEPNLLTRTLVLAPPLGWLLATRSRGFWRAWAHVKERLTLPSSASAKILQPESWTQ